MALETATYINDLNAANPAATDGLAQADDHFRLIKSAVKATFPNVTGAITATHGAIDAASTFAASITASAAEINVLNGISAGLTPAELSVLDGITASTANLNLVGTLPVVGTLAEGSVVVGNSSSVASAISIGASGTVLKSNGTTISWGAASGGVPEGTIILHAANTPPTGYLKADGSAVSRSTYAALFAVISTTYGAGDGSSTFNVPDLRGEFIRGWDDSRGVDSGRSFGSTQTDDFKLHGHPSRRATNLVQNDDDGGGLMIDENGDHINQPAYTGTPENTSGRHIGGAGGDETRPRNLALLACIKF